MYDVALFSHFRIHGRAKKGPKLEGTQRPPETESSVASMAGAITSPVSAMAASKVVRASRLLSKNITNPAGYVPSVSPADVAAFLRCPS